MTYRNRGAHLTQRGRPQGLGQEEWPGQRPRGGRVEGDEVGEVSEVSEVSRGQLTRFLDCVLPTMGSH